MSKMQFNITQHIKNWKKNLNLHSKTQTTDVNAEITEMLYLFDKDFESAIIKLFKQFIL